MKNQSVGLTSLLGDRSGERWVKKAAYPSLNNHLSHKRRPLTVCELHQVNPLWHAV